MIEIKDNGRSIDVQSIANFFQIPWRLAVSMLIEGRVWPGKLTASVVALEEGLR